MVGGELKILSDARSQSDQVGSQGDRRSERRSMAVEQAREVESGAVGPFRGGNSDAGGAKNTFPSEDSKAFSDRMLSGPWRWRRAPCYIRLCRTGF